MTDDLFTLKNLKPMLIGRDSLPFDDPEYIYELKWDGERCLAYLDPSDLTAHILPEQNQPGLLGQASSGQTELRNKRNLKMLPKVPELSGLHRQVNARCILDGELFILKDGKPDFSEIQRRSLMSNPFRIKIAGDMNPASFIAFDILYYQDHTTFHMPLMERKELLRQVVTDSPRMAVSRFIEGQGTALFEHTKSQSLEGIVAKQKDSIYIPDKRTTTWIKMKALLDDDFVVCGYIPKEGSMNSIVLGQYNNGVLIYKGHVTLGVGGQAFETILRHTRTDQPPIPQIPRGHGNDNAIWLEPTLVCTVKFMQYTKGGGMRQPVFKGLRTDKAASDCIEILRP